MNWRKKLSSASPLKLTTLHLWGNQIGDAGHKSLAHMIEVGGSRLHHHSIRTIRLHGNPSTAASVAFFSKAVQANHDIKEVRLAWETLPAGSRDSVDAYLFVNGDCQFGHCTEEQAVARKVEATEKLAAKVAKKAAAAAEL